MHNDLGSGTWHWPAEFNAPAKRHVKNHQLDSTSFLSTDYCGTGEGQKNLAQK